MVVSVVGDVDLATLPRLWTALERAEGPAVAVDLTSVSWFDPVCLGALVAAAMKVRRRSGRFTVLATGATAALLSESGLDGVFEVSADLPS